MFGVGLSELLVISIVIGIPIGIIILSRLLNKKRDRRKMGDFSEASLMEEFTNAEVIAIARKQKAIIWLILVSLLSFLFWPAQLLIAVINLVFVYQLAKSLKLTAWAWCIGMIVPLVSLILLVTLNSRATMVIRGKGVSVGLMGADKAQLEKLSVTM